MSLDSLSKIGGMACLGLTCAAVCSWLWSVDSL